MNTANDKYGSSLDRTLGAGKPVDPATRLSELLAQSLEELTRPFDPPRPGVAPVRAEVAAAGQPADLVAAVDERLAAEHAAPELSPEDSRIDADKALAELEAELFAAAKQVDRDTVDPQAEPDQPADPPGEEPAAPHDGQAEEKHEPALAVIPAAPAPVEPEGTPDPAAANVIAKVRKLMLISMAVTVIAVGSVFGLIGYRMFKGEGTAAKTADKLPEAALPADMTLALPRGARVLQSAVSADRLVITLEIDGKIEVRTFDVQTLQPAGRLNFSATP